MKKYLSLLLFVLLGGLALNAQPYARPVPVRRNHHTQRLPGVNERRLQRLEKMRQRNLSRRQPVGPLRAKAVPEHQRGLVLLVQFTDVKMQAGAAANWNNRFNQQGYKAGGHIGSLRDYFIEQSYGLLSIDFDVVGPLTVSKNHDYYGTPPNANLDDRAAEMVIEALKLANSQVNYADYDWDGDGEVDQVYVIFAGRTDYEGNGYIWPHEWSLYAANYYGSGSGYQTMDGVFIDTYAVSNELADNNTMEGIGTACHEFSHCLGYPDFYDTEYGGGTAGQNWDVLDGGCYNGPQGNGEVPCPYTAYERWAAGWIDLIPLTEPTKVEDMPSINTAPVAYVVNNSGNPNEYYILENRQQTTFGSYNLGHGLMVWHIDYLQSAWRNNEVNAVKNHQRMTFLPADGKVGTLRSYGDGTYYYEITQADEAGDPYPGSRKVTSVNPLTWYTREKGGTTTHANLIHDITERADGRISFIYGDYAPLSTPEVAEPTDLYRECFTANWLPVDGAESYTLQVQMPTGEKKPEVILSEDFSGFAASSQEILIGATTIDKYTQTSGWSTAYCYGTAQASLRVSSSKYAGSMTTPVLQNKAGTLNVKFTASYYAEDATQIIVNILRGTSVEKAQTVTLTSFKSEYELTFDDVPAGCRVQFASPSAKKRFYLYSVNISDMSGSGVTTVDYAGINGTSYTVEATEGTVYKYRVQAVCSEGSSFWSDWMSVDLSDADAVVDVRSEMQESTEIYDLTGRRMPDVPRRGIYLRQGRARLAQ